MRLISNSSRLASNAARSVGSASCLCALLSRSNASFARGCAHLSGCTRSESRQYVFLMAACSSSSRVGRGWSGGGYSIRGRVLWSSEDAQRASTPTTDREARCTVHKGGTWFAE
eukprot:1184770-Prorocentrum_minimum.AAC.1